MFMTCSTSWSLKDGLKENVEQRLLEDISVQVIPLMQCFTHKLIKYVAGDGGGSRNYVHVLR